MRATTVTLVRHAETEGGPGDPGLSEAGFEHARALASTIDGRTALVMTSPLTRAVSTAEVIAASLEIPVEIDDRLREQINWGDVPGQTFAEFVSEWDRMRADPSYAPPFGRSIADVGAEMKSFCRDMQERVPGGIVAAVTHGGVIAALIRVTLSGEKLAEALTRCDRMPFCATTAVSIREGEVAVAEVAGLSFETTR